MAIVTGISVPASLEDAYQRLVVARKTKTAGTRNCALTPSTHAARPAYASPEAQRFASFAGRWLTARHAQDLGPTERSAFYAARRAELLTGVFPAAYWTELAPIADRTQYGTPSCVASNKPEPPQYADPLHQSSICEYPGWNTSYVTPTPPGTEAQPSPGWRGEVAGTRFADLWMAQRMLRYALGSVQSEAKDQPIAARIDITITAQASTRGNRTWFTTIPRAVFYSSSVFDNSFTTLYDHWGEWDRYRYTIPDENPNGWGHTLSRLIVADLRTAAYWHSPSNASRMMLHIATAPALGRYHSRNDFVEVRHTEQVNVYLAKL